MNKIFIDCGYHLGEGLNAFTGLLGIDNTWDVYAFEANPYCEIEKKILQHPFKVNAFNKAVWIDDGTSSFNCQNQNQANSPTANSTNILDGWGSCLVDTNANHVYEGQLEVETINFSEFLKQFIDCEVYVKMDIEGAEFEVLRKCISDGTHTIINNLWVEWHDVNIPSESSKTVNEICKHLNNVKNWK
jgi:FkbM family methyltransferase